MTLLLAATNPDVGRLTLAYALGVSVFGFLLIGGLLYAKWATRDGRVGLFERWLDRHLARRRERAREENDQPILTLHRGRRPIGDVRRQP